MKIEIVKDHAAMSNRAAEIIANKVMSNKKAVLGLATGGTPEVTYELLVGKKLDWSEISTFNLDEYSNIEGTHEMSYRFYMNKHLFNHVNINKDNTHVPSGMADAAIEGPRYDEAIQKAGGIDLQLLGLGQNAHIGFNEPGSAENGGTAEVALTESTINANARYFNSADEVPQTAISMGIGSIMKAKEILLIASGESKAQAVKDMIEGKTTTEVPASFLQKHSNVTILIDEAAAKLLNK
ncbi:glucosamine-6-phosphate deaminase [Mycoplasma todarodis]|uniref:Glucosamine-6-phosphate deaminase n=1 Tax=Mycoplasma todarodis TaxID=1937191 RepID=A0A4R0XLG7_9MOLU|nr:glucosamine-6-phosphate deaminase [Mycoplasma todarodis]TCG11503.1 glucosamine-6-phosphate deaminase [Mycoplasma todarodis]